MGPELEQETTAGRLVVELLQAAARGGSQLEISNVKHLIHQSIKSYYII